MCTDGLSNVGIGALDNGKDKTSKPFYQNLGKRAKNSETAISVMGIEGGEVALECLGLCAELSGGRVDILHPLELVSEVQRIAQNPIIATNVDVKLVLHPLFKLSSATESGSDINFTTVKNIGNATAESDITFEFEVRAKTQQELKLLPKEIPFQTQIYYTKLDGSKNVKVITKIQPLTSDRGVAEKEADISLLALANVQQSGLLAEQGDYDGALKKLLAAKALLKKAAATDVQIEEFYAFKAEIAPLEYQIRKNLREQTANNSKATNDESAKVFLKSKTAAKTPFLSGAKKNVDRRQKGVFSDDRMRDIYYNKSFESDYAK